MMVMVMIMTEHPSYLPPQILFLLLNSSQHIYSPAIYLFIFFDFFGGGPANVTGAGPATLRAAGTGLSTISASLLRLGLVSFLTTWT